jgi:hypothetical protein
MSHPARCELVFPDPGTDEEVLMVSRTDRTGPGSHPVYADETGIVQAEINDRGEVRMIHRRTSDAKVSLFSCPFLPVTSCGRGHARTSNVLTRWHVR